MARKLTAGVVLRHPGGGVLEFLSIGSGLPGWAVGLVGDHALTPAELEPWSAADLDDAGGWPDLDETDPDDPASQPAVLPPPPRRGPGSARAAWLDYATTCGVDVARDAGRDVIIAACAAAGVATD